MERLLTAIHEAGHAVAHVRLSLSHDGAHIIPNRDGLLGAAAGEGPEHIDDSHTAESVVIACCAGYAALVAAGHADEAARSGADDDFEQACQVIESWSLPGGIRAWQDRAVALMREPENVAAVALVAEHLMQHERLDGDYVDVLVEMADGAISEGEFAQYLQLRGAAS